MEHDSCQRLFQQRTMYSSKNHFTSVNRSLLAQEQVEFILQKSRVLPRRKIPYELSTEKQTEAEVSYILIQMNKVD